MVFVHIITKWLTGVPKTVKTVTAVTVTSAPAFCGDSAEPIQADSLYLKTTTNNTKQRHWTNLPVRDFNKFMTRVLVVR